MPYIILNKNKIKKPKGILFDMDGVVLDSEKLYTRFWMEACKEKGYPMTMELALGMRSLNRTKGQAYLEKCFGKGINYAEIREIRVKRMDKYIEKNGVELKDGVVELLDFLKTQKLPCAITTSSPPERIKNHLKRNNIYDRFDKICSGYQVKNGKPEPDIYIFGAESLSLKPEECFAIEDSPAGIESAFRAGCMVIAVPDQEKIDEESMKLSTVKIDNLKDVIKLIKDI